MPRPHVDNPIQRATYRAKLEAHDEPRWKTLSRGCALGYRKTESGAESWLARWTNARGRYDKKFLGRADEMNYDEALRAAEDFFTLKRGGVSGKDTVADICKAYVATLKIEKGERAAHDAELLMTQHVYEKDFGRIEFTKLSAADVETFRNALVDQTRTKARVNRIMRSIKAALNHGFKKGKCLSDRPWKVLGKLTGSDAADGARQVFLTPEQINALLAEAGDSLAALLKGLAYTGARPSETSELVITRKSDFDPKQKTLTLRTFKGDGSEKKRAVPLSDAAVAFFRKQTCEELPGALIFLKDGRQWRRDEWRDLFKEAISAANKKIEDPEKRIPLETVAYSLRHTVISQWLRAGIGIGQVAKWAGTSVLMIEKTYAKFITDDTVRAALNKASAF
jgi:integrase